MSKYFTARLRLTHFNFGNGDRAPYEINALGMVVISLCMSEYLTKEEWNHLID